MTADNDEDQDLAEYRGNPLIKRLPKILTTDEAFDVLFDPPIFKVAERDLPAHIRPHCVMRLADYFEPLSRHVYLEKQIAMLIRQGYVNRNPATGDYLRRLQNAHERVTKLDMNASVHPIGSAAPMLTVIGCSGLGKSRSVERILSRYPQISEHSEPFTFNQVAWMRLECPSKGGPKALCISFFAELDRLLGTRDLGRFSSGKMTVDHMIVHMANKAELNALGVLVIDEIQNLMQAKNTDAEELLNFLVSMTNSVGIPIILIGTLGALPLLQDTFRIARRATGLGSRVWERYDMGGDWNLFIREMWKYQWTAETTPLTDEICEVLYDESQGIIDVVIKLFMLSQLRAIQLGEAKDQPEQLDADLIRYVAAEDFGIIRPMIDALRANDRKAIARYDDLRPLYEHLAGVFGKETGIPNLNFYKRQRSNIADKGDVRSATLKALENVGLAPDIAEPLLIQAIAENSAADGLSLISAVRIKLYENKSKGKSRARKDKTTKSEKPRVTDPQDLRGIGENAAGKGSVYDVLNGAGVIKPPVRDVEP